MEDTGPPAGGPAVAVGLLAGRIAVKSNAILMTRYGGPEVLEWKTRDLPPLGATEVRLRTLAAAVNHSDLEIRAGNWPILKDTPFPYVPGLEVVGEVVETGAVVRDFRIGDRAWTMMQGLGGVRAERPGGYAEHVTVPHEVLAPLPNDVDATAFAAIGLAGVTAHLGLEKLGELRGRRVVVTGAAGGVGSVAVSLAAQRGADVVAVVTRPEQIATARGSGANEVIVARTAETLAAALTPRSTDAVFDTVAGPLFPVLTKSLRSGGRLSLVGAVAGGDVAFDAWDLILPITLTGYSTEDLDGPGLRRATTALLDALRSPTFSRPPATVFALPDAATAHAKLERRELAGRVVLVPTGS